PRHLPRRRQSLCSHNRHNAIPACASASKSAAQRGSGPSPTLVLVSVMLISRLHLASRALLSRPHAEEPQRRQPPAADGYEPRPQDATPRSAFGSSPEDGPSDERGCVNTTTCAKSSQAIM